MAKMKPLTEACWDFEDRDWSLEVDIMCGYDGETWEEKLERRYKADAERDRGNDFWDDGTTDEDVGLSDYDAVYPAAPKDLPCTCGKDKHGFAAHADWCDKK